VFAAVLLGGPWIARRAPPAPSVYATSAGQLRTLVLPDGTKVRLDAGSRITVRFERGARQVAMAEGEAAFDVAHDPARPFLIGVGDRQVRVVGTEFDVKHRAGRLQITVRRGVVEVRPADALAAAPVRLTAGEQLTHADGAAQSQVAQVDPAEAFGWTVGQLIYRDRPLSEVAGDLSRRFGMPIRAADPQTARIRFTGVLAADSAPAVLRRLEAFVGVRAEPSGGGYVLRRTGRRP
jgi:transmembrane sensor